MNTTKTTNNISIWKSTEKEISFQPLTEERTADVCIVGAGITGLTTAYLLSKEGKKVIVLDKSTIAGGESGRTTAHISDVIDDRFSEVEKTHGEDVLKLAYDSQKEAINQIEQIVNELKIDCQFRRVNAYLLLEENEKDILEEELEFSKKLGMKAESVQSPLENFKNNLCIKYHNQAQFHILKYLNGLIKGILNNNGEIFTNSFVNEFNDDKKQASLKLENGISVKASKIVVATNSPISDFTAIHTKQTPMRTYAIAYEVPKGSYEIALYWDNKEPYHYIRLLEDDNSDYLIIGGEDHKTGQENNTENRFECLEDWAKTKFSNIGKLKFKWSGQVLEPLDYLSFTGIDPANENNIYIATGDSGMGMTHGTFSAMIIRDLIMGRENKWAEIYDPKRKVHRKLGEFLKEGADVVGEYLEYVSSGDAEDEEQINTDEGAIIDKTFKKIAVYKDKDGQMHRLSAVCTHLKCIVQWNNSEKSWDCPCHGSRFDIDGKVLNGPAIKKLSKLDKDYNIIEEKEDK